MVTRNHEIRFPTTAQLKETIDSFYLKLAMDLKKTSFYQKVFLLGLDSLKNQLIRKGGDEILIDLMKRGKK